MRADGIAENLAVSGVADEYAAGIVAGNNIALCFCRSADNCLRSGTGYLHAVAAVAYIEGAAYIGADIVANNFISCSADACGTAKDINPILAVAGDEIAIDGISVGSLNDDAVAICDRCSAADIRTNIIAEDLVVSGAAAQNINPVLGIAGDDIALNRIDGRVIHEHAHIPVSKIQGAAGIGADVVASDAVATAVEEVDAVATIRRDNIAIARQCSPYRRVAGSLPDKNSRCSIAQCSRAVEIRANQIANKLISRRRAAADSQPIASIAGDNIACDRRIRGAVNLHARSICDRSRAVEIRADVIAENLVARAGAAIDANAVAAVARNQVALPWIRPPYNIVGGSFNGNPRHVGAGACTADIGADIIASDNIVTRFQNDSSRCKPVDS